MKVRLRHRLEYAMLRGLGVVLARLPYRLALGLGWAIAGLGFHVIRFRRREAERRIREVFGTRFAAREVRRIAWQSLRNLCFVAVEVIRAPAMKPRWFRRVADYEAALAAWSRDTASGRGLIVACPHAGSWELAGASCAASGLRFFSIAGKQRNPLFDAYLNRTRQAMGLEMLMRGAGTMRAIMTNLRAGKILAMLPDVRMPTPGVRVRFLGREANVGPGMAAFARHADVPIYPIINRRHGWARHEGVLHPPVRPDPAADRDADVQRMTQQVFDIFTRAIEDNPGQWFWYNKRWIFDPVEPQQHRAADGTSALPV